MSERSVVEVCSMVRKDVLSCFVGFLDEKCIDSTLSIFKVAEGKTAVRIKLDIEDKFWKQVVVPYIGGLSGCGYWGIMTEQGYYHSCRGRKRNKHRPDPPSFDPHAVLFVSEAMAYGRLQQGCKYASVDDYLMGMTTKMREMFTPRQNIRVEPEDFWETALPPQNR